MKRSISIFTLLLFSTACVTIRPLAAPQNFIPSETPDFVWVQQQDGELYQVTKPAMHGDTLIGTRFGTSEPVHLGLPQIRSISARQVHPLRSTLLFATASFLAGFVVWRALESGPSGSNCVYLTDNNQWICP